MSAHHAAVLRRWPVGLAAAGLVLAIAGCGSTSTSSSAASCVALTPSQQRNAASIIFIGTALPGPTVTDSGRQVLVSPAHFRVERYIKGNGPGVVAMQTAVQTAGGRVSISEDGITPQGGQRWTIYVTSPHQPYATNICLGSAVMKR